MNKKSRKKRFAWALAVSLFILPIQNGQAWLMDGGAGWVNATYLAQILLESIKQYQQLRMILKEAKGHDKYLRALNSGLENSMGLLSVLPIKDERILGEIKSFKDAMGHVETMYGEVPKSGDELWQRLQDQTVAEGFKMAGSAQDYAQKQEENSVKLAVQAREASPKGAVRMIVESNAQILHSINQLLKLNAQMLKLQGENLASNNRESKLATSAHLRTVKDISGKMQTANGDFGFPAF